MLSLERPRSYAQRLCTLAALSAVAGLSACYSGVQPDPGEVELDPEGSGSGEADGDSSGEGGDEAELDCDEVQVGLSPLRRLTRVQYTNSVRDLLDVDVDPTTLPADERADAVGSFSSNVLAPISENAVRDYQRAAEWVVATSTAGGAPACDPGAGGAPACAREFIIQFGRRAFRRSLTPDEVSDFETLFAGTPPEDSFADRIGLVAETMLQSPDFLYMVELGVSDLGPSSDIVALAEYELATRLSFFLWSTTPDDTLLDAAAAGELQTDAGLLAQAERLLESPRARDSIASFHTQWLGIEELEETTKSPDQFPEYNASLAAAMVRETVDFADYVIRAGDGRLQTLLTASFTLAEPSVLALYNADPTTTDAEGRTQLDATERVGLLTHASVLSAHAHPNQSSIVLRGALVRRRLMCEQLPLPGPDIVVTVPDPIPNQSTRERFDQHRDDPACSGCHVLMDPIGYGLLAYDAIGRRIEQDGNQDIDESGRVAGGLGDGNDGEFVGPVELATGLADSEIVRSCVAQQWMTFAVGYPLGDADLCTSNTIAEIFVESGGDMPSLLLAVVQSDAFRLRRTQP